ncbi:MAG: hypothetical protein GQ475_07490 [Methylococcaceae bacterium]|nr:hypothetical protein [Methylococcaceae bacterium]
MNKFLTGLLLLASSMNVLADNLSNSNKLFDFAEGAFPQYFSPAGMETQVVGDYLLRQYPANDVHAEVYLGTQGGNVYAFTEATGLLALGQISNFVDTQFKFTTEYLNGKTLYEVFDDRGSPSEPIDLIMAEMIFTDTTVTMAELNSSGVPLGESLTVPYSITSEGYVTFDDDGEMAFIRVIDEESDYLGITWDDTAAQATNAQIATEWMYFNKEQGRAFMTMQTTFAAQL